MQARFPVVLKHVVDMEAATRSPHSMREHIFDFSDGVRVMAVLEKARTKVMLHFYVGTLEGICQLSLQGFEQAANKRPFEIAGQNLNVFDRWVDDHAYHLVCDPPKPI